MPVEAWPSAVRWMPTALKHAWLFVLLFVAVLAAWEDVRRLTLSPALTIALLAVWTAGVFIEVTLRPWWTLAVVLLTLWRWTGGLWGWGFLLFPPLIPLALTAAASRRGYIGDADLMLFSALHLALPWWGPWLVSLGWHVYILHRQRQGYGLVPAVPGLLVGWAAAMLGMMAIAYLTVP